MGYWPEAPLGLTELSEITARFRGMQSNVAYAEAFWPGPGCAPVTGCPSTFGSPSEGYDTHIYISKEETQNVI
jgi:hypothetical protein